MRNLLVVLTAVAAGLAACDSNQLLVPNEPQQLSNPAAPAISDANHIGGNPNFFWLPPLSPETSSGGVLEAESPSGVFDGTLAPVVRICEFDEVMNWCVTDVANFTTTGLASAVRVEPDGEHYIVNWHTNRYSLNESATYRIMVVVEGVRLGFVDVRLVGRGGGTEDAANGYFPLRYGRTLPIKFRIERSPTLPPDDLHLTFSAQPGQAQAGAVIQPPVEVTLTDGAGTPSDGTVSLALAPGYCGASLSGTMSVTTQNGVATFADLSVDLLGDGYALTASSGPASGSSTAFAITSSVTGEPLTQETTLCISPTVQHDASALAYIPRDDALWSADDNLGGAITGIARASGAVLKTITQSEFMAAFPDAVCDDGDGDPATSCSYFNEFEIVAYDRQGGSLYVISTVNDPNLDPPVDRPAIFRLVRRGCASCFKFDAWRALPEGLAYNGAVVADGDLYVADVRRLHRYDFEDNVVDTAHPVVTASARIRGLSYDGTHLWALTRTGVPSGSHPRLTKFDWATGQEVVTYLLDPWGVIDFAGIEVVDGSIYLLHGTPPNPIHVFAETAGSP